MIVAACGTVSSVASDILKSLPVPAIGVVEATAAAAVRATRNNKIGIIGTAATVRSGSFEQAILAINPALTITAEPCPLFVPLVEAGWIDPTDDVAVPTVRRYLAPFKAAGIDTLILGCTHFPLLAPIIAAELGNDVTLIDSGYETAVHCADILRRQNALSNRAKNGTCHFIVSDQPEGFTRTAEIFLGRSVKEDVQMVLQKG